MPKHDTITYWLSVVEAQRGHTVVEAEAGYKPCKKPGPYRVWQGPTGPCCPGCDRVCRIPATAGLGRDDLIVVHAPAKPKPKRVTR